MYNVIVFNKLTDDNQTLTFQKTDFRTITTFEEFERQQDVKSLFSSKQLSNYKFPKLKNGNGLFIGNTSISVELNQGGDFGQLENGFQMFADCSNMNTFDCDMPKLTYSVYMFAGCTSLIDFKSDLRSLENNNGMFAGCTNLETFEGNLDSLINGDTMFASSNKLHQFSAKLPKIKTALSMFNGCNLSSFVQDLPSLVCGAAMFSGNSNFTSFVGDLQSLETGFLMFSGCKLDEQSFLIISDAIKDVSSIQQWDPIVLQLNADVGMNIGGVMHVSYDSNSTSTDVVLECCDRMAEKGWTVYLNDIVPVPDNGAIETASLEEESNMPITPVYYKPVECNKEYANWTNGEKYYILLGGKFVFGDDISTYGMFTSIEDAAMNMGLTAYTYNGD